MNTTRQSVIVVAMLLCAATLCAAADRTPLHWAAAGGNEQAIAELLSQGAVPNAVDEHGDTPLHLAARQLRLEAVRLLLAADADANARNAAGQTPLHVVGADARPDVDDADYLALPGVIAQEIMAAGGDPGLLDEHGTAAWPHVAEVPTGDRQPTGYPTYDEIAATLLAWQNTYPSICQRYDLGASSTTKHIYALKISDNVGVEEDEPEMKYISTMHGDEVVGVVMCLNLIELLVTNYGTNPRYTNIIDEMEIWIVPCMNPYGYTYNTRYNASGADLNRSFPEGAPPNPEPNSTSGRPPEVATIMNWSADHSFTLAANFHGGALVVNFPYDNDGSETYYTPDDDLFIAISEEYSEDNLPMWNGSWYHGITRGGDWYEIDGGMQDWSYRYMSCNEVTIELGNTKSPSYSQMPTYWSQNQESMLSYMETCLIGVRGVVTDGSGTPLAATVTVAGRDHPIYTDPDVGDYHRMLLPGTYDLTFETDGYDPITVEDVVVTAGDATVVDVQFVGAPVVTYPNGGELLTAGVPIDVTWVGSPAQQFHVQYTSNFGQFDTTTDDFERTTLGADYTTGGDASWATTSSQAHGGTRSARAGAVTHGQSSWMTRTVGEVQVSFWYYVNSETNYDFFNFYVDASRKIHASGYGSWTLYSIMLGPGTHELKWEYIKDAGVSVGSDTVWIDDLGIGVDTTVWTDIIALTATGATSTPWTPAIEGTEYKVRVQAYEGVYGPWDESDDVFTVEAAPEQGACCAADGTCTFEAELDCAGDWLGVGTDCDPNPCPQPWCLGDLNCSGGSPTFEDISYFVAALSGEANWMQYYRDHNGGQDPTCPWLLGNYNGTGGVEFGDIVPFANSIGGDCVVYVP